MSTSVSTLLDINILQVLSTLFFQLAIKLRYGVEGESVFVSPTTEHTLHKLHSSMTH